MKTLFIFILSGLCFSFIGNEPSALSSKRMNVLYLGLDNPITISHPKYSCDRLVVRLEPESLARLEPAGCGKYHLKLLRRDRHGINLLVYKDQVKPRNLLSRQSFRTLKIPRPVASINGATGPHLSVEELLKATEVEVECPGLVYEGINYQVSRFDFMYKPIKGKMLRGTSYSEQFPENMLKAISQPKEDDLLIVTGIYAESPSLGELPLAGSLVFKIKE